MFIKNRLAGIFISVAMLVGLFPNLALAALHSVGTNVISPNGTVYTISLENGITVKRPYTSSGAFLSFGFNSWESIVGASSEDLALPTGSFIAPQDGKIICSDRGGDRGTCYLITDGKRAGFTSADVFRRLGFSFEKVTSGDVSFLPVTTNIDSPTQAHVPGTIINKDGKYFLVVPNGILGIANEEVLKSWGYTLADITTANDADRALAYLGELSRREMVYLTPLRKPIDGTLPPVKEPLFTFETQTLPVGQLNTTYTAKIYFNYHTAGENYATNAYFSGLPAGIITGSSSGPDTTFGILPGIEGPNGRASVQISGIPTVSGTYTVTLTLSDQHTVKTQKTYSLNIQSPRIPSDIRVGQVINKDGTIYLVATNGLLGFPTLAVFNSWGFCFADALPANASEKTLTQVGVMPMKPVNADIPSWIPPLKPSVCVVEDKPNLTVALDAASTPIAQTVQAGTTDVIFTGIVMYATGGDVNLGQMSIGADTASGAALVKNIRLFDGTTEVGSVQTLSNVSADGVGRWGTIQFSGGRLIPNNSAKRLTIKADAVAGLAGVVKLGVVGVAFNPGYNANVTLPSNLFGNPVTVQLPRQGVSSLNVSLSAATPISQTVDANKTDVKFSTFNLTAIGSDVGLSKIYVNSDSANGQTNIKNVRVIDASTNTVLGSVASLVNVGADGNQRFGVVNLNSFVITKDSTRTVTLMADISSSATGSTKLGINGVTLNPETNTVINLPNNLFGYPVTFNSAIDDTVLELQKIELSNNTLTPGVPNQTALKFKVTNKTSTARQLNIISVHVATTNAQASEFSQMYWYSNGVLLGNRQMVNNFNSIAGTYYIGSTGSTIPLVTVPALGSIDITINVDVPASAVAGRSADFHIFGYTLGYMGGPSDPVGKYVKIIGGTTVSNTVSIGQSATSTGAVVAQLASSNPTSLTISRGSQGVNVMAFNLANPSGEKVSLASLRLVCQGCGGAVEFSEARIYRAGTLVGTAKPSAGNPFIDFDLTGTPLELAVVSISTFTVQLDLIPTAVQQFSQNFYIELRSVGVSKGGADVSVGGLPLYSSAHKVQ